MILLLGHLIKDALEMELLLLGSYTRLSCTLIKVKIVSGYNDTPHSLPLPNHLPLYWMNELTNK